MDRNERRVRLDDKTAPDHIANTLIFASEDDQGALQVWAPDGLWEQLLAETPLPNDEYDRRDYALGRLEGMAQEHVPQIAPTGIRVVLL